MKATGASSNLDSSWNPERHDAANANIAYTMTMMRPMPLVRPVVSAMPDHLQSVYHDQNGWAYCGHNQIGPTCFIGYPPEERYWGQDHCCENITPEFPTRTVDGHR